MPDIPHVKNGTTDHIIRIARELQFEKISGQPATALASVKKQNDMIMLNDMEIPSETVPDVRGMGAADAVFILENAGLKVRIRGFGKVMEQSLSPGSGFTRGEYVYLTLG